jgi:hypothetical protein
VTAPATGPAAWDADPDQPIPFTLTPKALAALASPADTAGEWACRGCGDAFFGTAPETGLCLPCQDSPSAGAR